jgi:hypothetical protein
MNSEWFINSIILKEIKYRLNIQFMNKVLYNQFIILLTSRLLQTSTLNLQQLRLSRNTKNSFTLVELGLLHKNGLSSLSVTRVTTHSKMWVTTHSKIRSEWQHTQKGEHYSSKRVSTTAQENLYKKITKDQVGRIERS